MVTVGERFKHQAQWLGIPDAEVARRLGIEPTRYHHYVSDRHFPKPDMFLKICRALEMTPNQAFGVDPMPYEAEVPPSVEQRVLTSIAFDLKHLPLTDLELVRNLIRDLAKRASAPKTP